MHISFIPVVHTVNKKGENIDKMACSEFWKERDSYRQLQDCFHLYMVCEGFNLERGIPSDTPHLSVEQYKKVTNFENSVKTLSNIELALPAVPDIKEFHKLTLNRDKKIEDEIIKPKDNLINNLYEDNTKLYTELQRQVNIINKAEKFEKEKQNILAENTKLKEENIQIQKDNEFNLRHSISNATYDLKDKIHTLEKENNFLKRVINKFEKAIDIFIKWVCSKFAVSSESLVRDFEKENYVSLDVQNDLFKKEKQKKHKEELEF